MKSIDEAHRDDYAQMYRMRDLRQALETFLTDPPSRAYPRFLDDLRDAIEELAEMEAHIVRVWD